MDNQLSKGLIKRIQALAPIVAGFRQALQNLSLSEKEKQVLIDLLARYGTEYEESRRNLKQLSRASASPDGKRKEAKRPKPKQLGQIELTYQKERARKIEETHQRSGYHQQTVHFVQGGAPGSGKGS